MDRTCIAVDDKNCSSVTLSIAGRFDIGLYEPFIEAIGQASDWDKKVTIDLSATDYLDSSALGLLLMLRDQVDELTTICLRNPTPAVVRILSIANFDKLFLIDAQKQTVC